MENLLPRPIYEEILNLKAVINEVSFMHVYREMNCLADSLSKEGLLMDLGTWHVWHLQEGVMAEHDPGPFI